DARCAVVGAFREPQSPRPAWRAARRRRPALQLRGQRGGAPARAVRADALDAARADRRDARVPGADPRRGPRPVPRRRSRGGDGGRAHLRGARCAVRPAGDEARRLRARRLRAAAVPREPARGRRPAAVGALDRRRRGEGDRARAAGRRRSGRRRARVFRCAPCRQERLEPLARARCRPRADDPPGAHAPGGSRGALSRATHGDARRQRRVGRFPRQTQARMGAPLMTTENPVQAIVERCQTLFEDLDFNAVRQWKEAAPGRKAIGYMPVYVPRELIHAAGRLPVGILGGGDQLEVIQGDAYYQSYICRIPRSTIELGLTGRLDCLDGMLFPSICDVIRNLSGMWQLMFKDKYVRYFDVPQNYEDEVGGRFYVHELEVLREDLERLGGKPVTEEDLRRSIQV